ncbi:MAG: uroporphyrinogen decarboxylase family protein, partial [Dehalococcoidia bacterium]
MTWQEKREERFNRWINSTNVEFINPEANKLYRERVTRFIKTIKLEEPDRVPVMLPTGNFPAYHAGLDLRTIMYDPEALLKAWIKFMDDFGDMDSFRGPSLTSPGKILDVLDPKTQKWPGHGLPEDASMNQIVENEYMLSDEYDKWMTDPSDYQLRVNLPRTTGLFQPLKNLPPLRSMQAANWVRVMSDPNISSTFQMLINLANEHRKWEATMSKLRRLSIERGYPSLTGGLMAGAPFDYFADLLRGTHGIAMDMFRQPQKLHEAMERYLNNIINTTFRDFPMTDCPIIMMPLHKGDDTFMSDKQFEEFYWPYLRRLLLAMVNEGLVPMPFAEGKFTNRLKQITDTPKSSIIWYFDQTDMAEAKRILGRISCIAGNVPTSIVKTAPPEIVKEHCRKLIEECSSGGGYILSGGASIDKGNIENLKVMM